MFIWVFLYDVTEQTFWSTQCLVSMSGQPKLSFLHCTISQIIMQSMTILLSTYYVPGTKKVLKKLWWRVRHLPAFHRIPFLADVYQQKWTSKQDFKYCWDCEDLNRWYYREGLEVGEASRQGEQWLHRPHRSKFGMWKSRQETPWLELRTCRWWGVILETAGRSKVWLLCNGKHLSVLSLGSI